MSDDGELDAGLQPAGPDGSFAVMETRPPVTGLRDMLALLKGNSLLILTMVLISLSAGVAYLAYAPARYIASATLLVDPASSSMPEEYYIESQTQTMRSDVLVRAVIEQLHLVEAGIDQDDRNVFLDPARAAKRFVVALVPGLASEPETTDPVQEAVSTLRRNLTVTRPAMTPVISIAYNSTDPDRAADVVNALIQVYVSQRRRDATTASDQSVAWLTQRLDGLRQQLENADRAAENFKTTNNILGVGANHGLQAEQRLYELGIQIEAARAAVDRASGQDGNAPDTSKNTPAVPSRETRAGNEIAMLSEPFASDRRLTDFGLETDAPQSRSENAEAENAELVDARQTLASLEDAFEDATFRAREANRQRTQLNELEASAEIYRTLHAGMLQRYEEAVQQGSLPVSDGAQVLIAARAPSGRSQPRPFLVLAFAGAFGATLGAGAAVLRSRPESDVAGA
ncbi:GumC family protein [Aliihoeflea sp. PC F10.4]